MEHSQMLDLCKDVFQDCTKLLQAGQKEYSHDTHDAFANFNRIAARLNLDRKAVLMVFTEKHIDGIHSYLKGHRSQREDITGRINDVIVYMCLLRVMIHEERLMEEERNLYKEPNLDVL